MTTETMKTAAGQPNPLVVVPLAALLEMARAHDKVCAALVETKADRDQARRDWSIASEQLTRADAKRAEVERERDKALQELQEREVDLQNAIAGNMPLAELAVLAETHAKAQQERDDALAKLAEARAKGEAELASVHADAARVRMDLQDERDAERRRAVVAERERDELRSKVANLNHRLHAAKELGQVTDVEIEAELDRLVARIA